MNIRWEEGFEIRVAVQDGEVVVSANREGLLSLANIISGLADGKPGDHVHLDEHNSLEDESVELVIERTE